MDLKIGCTGWSYAGWLGTFYPANIKQSNQLKFYSSVFDITEVNSTFYRIPSQFVTRKWFSDTPKNFLFTAKFPKQITHDNCLKNVKPLVKDFISSLVPLKNKIIALVLQLPPFLSFDDAKSHLIELLHYIPQNYKIPIEGRHESWFTDEARDFMVAHNLCLVWNEVQGVSNPCPITSDFLYLRLIGDREIKEHEFGRIVRDKKETIQRWATKLNEIQNEVELAIVMINNRLEGFAPASVNTIRTLLGLEELNWDDKNQTKLIEFEGKQLHDLYRHSTKLIK
jgi:uncharacterized protein YecE (DUF72 family)